MHHVSGCLGAFQTNQALIAHLGPRSSNTALILLFSEFHMKVTRFLVLSELEMHATSVQTYITQSFSHRCQKGPTHSPKGKDHQVVVKTEQMQSR